MLAQIPEEARHEDFGGAVAFSRFFLELYAPMFAPPYDTELFAYLCTDAANFCQSSLANAAETEAAGAYSGGGAFTWTDDFPMGGLNEDGYWYVTQTFSQTDTTTYLADGTQHRVSRGGTGVVGVKLAFENGAWRVYGVEFQYDDE